MQSLTHLKLNTLYLQSIKLKVCHMSILELLVVHFIPNYRDHLKKMRGFRAHYYRVPHVVSRAEVNFWRDKAVEVIDLADLAKFHQK